MKKISTQEIKQMILEEAISIKNLVEEKKQIEESLKNLEVEKKEIEDEGVGIGISKTLKKSIPQRLDDPHLKKEEIEEGDGIGIEIKKGKNVKPLHESKEINTLRKAIRKQLYEDYKVNE